MPGEITGASLAMFVLAKSGCCFANSRLADGSDVLAFSPAAATRIDSFFAAEFHGIQCLYHAAPSIVTARAVARSVRRKTPPRNPGVKLPLARSRRLAFGCEMVKAEEGFGRMACSAAISAIGS